MSAGQEFPKDLFELFAVEREDRNGLAGGEISDQIFDRAVCFFLFHSHRYEHGAQDADVHVCLAVDGVEPAGKTEHVVDLFQNAERRWSQRLHEDLTDVCLGEKEVAGSAAVDLITGGIETLERGDRTRLKNVEPAFRHSPLYVNFKAVFRPDPACVSVKTSGMFLHHIASGIRVSDSVYPEFGSVFLT